MEYPGCNGDIDYSICDKANRAVLDLLQEKEEKKD